MSNASATASPAAARCSIIGQWGDCLRAGQGLLTAPAAAELAEFVRRRRARGGGHCGLAGNADLYFTAFALELESALAILPSAETVRWLHRCAETPPPDLLHAASLLRAMRAAGLSPDGARWRAWLDPFRAADGEWRLRPHGGGGPYAIFLGTVCFSALDLPPPAVTGPAIRRHATPTGAFAADALHGLIVPVAAAALSALASAGETPPPEALQWLVCRRLRGGGWLAADGATVPDLLATATVRFALWRVGCLEASWAADDIDLVAAHAVGDGGFGQTPAAAQSDVESSWYALLALGTIVLPTRLNERPGEVRPDLPDSRLPP